MTQTEDCQSTIRLLRGKLSIVYKYLLEHNDQDNADKVKQLANKLINEEFTIAFCGHFSAGKSKMINCLVGENLLPSSPIPTSANLVKVRAGEEYAKVFFKNEKPRLYSAPYDYEIVKNYCKDGDQIKEVEISHQDINLPSKTLIMDTPGIDSADDAHRIATESAIYLADLIFYVMDYNHVQSELNFMFTKELMDSDKEVYLVINQIDKHSDKELSFKDFKTSVVLSFASWGVKPAGIFYTSLKEDNHEHNQFSKLKVFLEERLEQKETLLLQSIFYSLEKIIIDHFDLIKKKDEKELKLFKDVLNELSPEEYTDLSDNYENLYEEKDALAGGREKAEKEFDFEVKRILDNAYLMPFQTRELAASYLQSCQREFKVGFLFRKQKTLAERQKRLDIFYQQIIEKIKSQVEWHLCNFLLNFLKENRIENKELIATAQSFHVNFSSELLTGTVKKGALYSEATVMNYTADVVNEIKRIEKSSLARLKDEILNALEEKNEAIKVKIAKKIEGLKSYINAFEQVKKYEKAERVEREKFEKLLSKVELVDYDFFELFNFGEEEFEVVNGESGKVEKVEKQLNLSFKKSFIKEKNLLRIVESSDRMKQTTEKLKNTAELTKDLPGFRKIASELLKKAERLDNKGFTVALFGAFSAGKSSFANALIGESVLPVSPNPMTAAINNIKPINESYQHGTVIIKLKEEASMLEDVNHALKVFDFYAESLEDAILIIEKLDGNQGVDRKTNYTFLQAFKRKFSVFREQFGSVLETTIAEFSDYVADEEKSCFVEWIDLYYDCPLTRKGITLVDTPGADSINARHTAVAFDFIKNSDAILFVTYYNHAFSKADREFLIQLGRVKDSFQLDKMFFIINAIDLADNEDEKEDVIGYVHTQLIKYGVRNPNLYPLSSLYALKEKKEQVKYPVSEMSIFEESFYQFITNDLANLASESSLNELKRVYHLVEKLINSTKEDALVKQKKRENIKAEKDDIKRILTEQTVENLINRLNQETEELIYYIKQRVFLRFNDFFKESFNPAVIRDDGRNLKKTLENALNELLEQIGFDFAQEMRATTVRLDRFAEKMITEYQKTLGEIIYEVNQDLSFSIIEFKDQAEIDFNVAFKDIPHGLFVKAMGYFKTPKSFFEKNESKLMSDEIYKVLHSASDEYLQNERKRIQALYDNVMEDEFEKLILQMKEQVDDFYLSLLSALDGGVPVKQLNEIKERLTEFI